MFILKIDCCGTTATVDDLTQLNIQIVTLFVVFTANLSSIKEY